MASLQSQKKIARVDHQLGTLRIGHLADILALKLDERDRFRHDRFTSVRETQMLSTGDRLARFDSGLHCFFVFLD
jgi:hypothetical protein